MSHHKHHCCAYDYYRYGYGRNFFGGSSILFILILLIAFGFGSGYRYNYGCYY